MVTCLVLTLHPIQQRICLLFSIASSTRLGHIGLLLAAFPSPSPSCLKLLGPTFSCFALTCHQYRSEFWMEKVTELSQHFSQKSQIYRTLIRYGKLHLKLVPGSAREELMLGDCPNNKVLFIMGWSWMFVLFFSLVHVGNSTKCTVSKANIVRQEISCEVNQDFKNPWQCFTDISDFH